MENNSPEIKVDTKVSKKLENFWFYHKWHVLVAIFVLLVLIVCTLQMCENESKDVAIIYAGPYATTQSASIRQAFGAVIPKDFNGDGKKAADLVMLFVCSEEQIRDIESTTFEDGSHEIVDRKFIQDQYQQFNNLVMIGAYSICIIDPWLYNQVNDAGGFATLKDTLGYKPENARDENSICLADTEFGEYYKDVLGFPEDSVLCMRKIGTVSSWFNQNKSQKEYQNAVDTFRAIVEFKAPQ